MKEKKIIHIDYGTRGDAGLYLIRIIENLKENFPGQSAYVHVDFYGEFNDVKVFKFFERYTKIIPFNFLKKVYKFFNLYTSFFKIILNIKKDSYMHECYVVVSLFQSFWIYQYFIDKVSKFAKVIVIVHDAVELKSSYPKFLMTKRDRILKNSYALLVHGESSIKILEYLNKKMFSFPFPLYKTKYSANRNDNEKITILFIGHIREEKGLDLLLDAWGRICNKYSNIELRVRGSMALTESKINFVDFSTVNIRIAFLTDEEFREEIADSDYVALPYRGGTNSAVFSVAVSLGKPCITSDIPLFTQSSFSIPELMFKAGDEKELTELLSRVILEHSKKYREYINYLDKRVAEYEQIFKNDLNVAFNAILKIEKL